MAAPNFARNQASFAVHVGGVDVSEKLNPYLTAIDVRLTSAHASDMATIELADNHGELGIPALQTPWTIDLGWIGWGSARVFEGWITEIHSVGSRAGGRSLIISGEAANYLGPMFKFPRELHKDQSTFDQAASEFGAKAGLSVMTHADLGSLSRAYWSMNGESFAHWGQRMAQEIGATFRVAGNKAVFLPRSGGFSASGLSLGSVTADFTDGGNGLSWDIVPQTSRPPHASFSTRFFDMAKTTWGAATKAGGGLSSALGLLRFAAPDEASAGASASGAAEQANRDAGQGRVQIVGDPQAQVDGGLTIVGARSGVDGPYTIDGVEHRYSRSEGFISSIELVQPGGSLGGGGGSGEAPASGSSNLPPGAGGIGGFPG